MDILIEYLVNEVKNKGIKGIIPLLSIIILTLIFISPSYTFILFFKRSLFSDYKLIINIITVLILDIVLFLVLFVIGSLRDIDVVEVELNGNKELKFIPNGTKTKDVIMTIILMGLVSIVMTLVYAVFLIKELDTNTTTGVITLCITLDIIFLGYILTIMKKATVVIWNRAKENGVKVLFRILIIIFYCLILIVEIIIKILYIIWNMIFNGKNIKV